MKRILFKMILLVLAVSCSGDDDKNSTEVPELLGSWKLVAMYADPGDGSGDFVSIESDKTISFKANGILESNANLCYNFSDSGESSDGVYSQEDETITIGTCGIAAYQIFFRIVNANLIVSYPCIEACQEKYEKIN